MKHSKAVAVGYTLGENAPKVLARGNDHMADLLKKIAEKHGVPVIESPQLAESLSRQNSFEDVPEEYWVVIAEILNFVYDIQRNR